MDKEVVFLGRFVPIGEKTAHGTCRGVETATVPRYAALLDAEGHPLCQTVRLERIVPEPGVSAERAEKEFLDLTEGL